MTTVADLRVWALARRANRARSQHTRFRLYAELVNVLGGSGMTAREVTLRALDTCVQRVTLDCGDTVTLYPTGDELDADRDPLRVGVPVFCGRCAGGVGRKVTRVTVDRVEVAHDRVTLACGHATWFERNADRPKVGRVGDTRVCWGCRSWQGITQVYTPGESVSTIKAG